MTRPRGGAIYRSIRRPSRVRAAHGERLLMAERGCSAREDQRGRFLARSACGSVGRRRAARRGRRARQAASTTAQRGDRGIGSPDGLDRGGPLSSLAPSIGVRGWRRDPTRRRAVTVRPSWAGAHASVSASWEHDPVFLLDGSPARHSHSGSASGGRLWMFQVATCGALARRTRSTSGPRGWRSWIPRTIPRASEFLPHPPGPVDPVVEATPLRVSPIGDRGSQTCCAMFRTLS